MKNILIPTDFSPNALFAVDYGIEIACKMGAAVTILNVFDIPLVADQAYFENDRVENWEEEYKTKLYEMTEDLAKKHPDLQVNSEAKIGVAEDVILGIAQDFDLIVMGSKGQGNLGDVFFGDVTLDIIRQSKVPVLVIPTDVLYKPLKSIILASKNDELISDKVINTVKELVGLFHAKLNLLNIVTHISGPITAAYHEMDKIKAHFEGIEYSVNVTKAENVVEGINDFANETEADLIVVVPEKHNLFERVFAEMHTRHLVKVSHRPLLVVHG